MLNSIRRTVLLALLAAPALFPMIASGEQADGQGLLTQTEVDAMRAMTAADLAGTVESSDPLRVRYATLELARDAESVYRNYGLLENALGATQGLTVAEQMARAIKRMPYGAEKKEVLDRFMAFLDGVAERSGTISRVRAIGLMAETIIIDQHVTPRYGIEALTQVLKKYMVDGDQGVRTEACMRLGYVAVVDLAKTEEIVGLLEGRPSREAEAPLAFIRRGLASGEAQSAAWGTSRLSEDEFTAMHSMTRPRLRELALSGRGYTLQSKYAFRELVRTCGPNDLEALVALAFEASSYRLRPLAHVALLAKYRAEDGLTSTMDQFLDLMEQMLDDETRSSAEHTYIAESLFDAVGAPAGFSPGAGQTYRPYGYERVLDLLKRCAGHKDPYVRQKAARYLSEVFLYKQEGWEEALSFLEALQLRESHEPQDERKGGRMRSQLDSAVREVQRRIQEREERLAAQAAGN